jgi:hypothetical protein
MSGLLPQLFQHAVHHRGIAFSSGTFGVVPVVLCLVLLFGIDIAGMRGHLGERGRMVVIIATPLAIVAALTIAARIALLLA